MRALLLAAAAGLLAACSQPATETPVEAAADEGCMREYSRQVTFSNSQQPDTISVTAEGPNCRQAVVTLVLRNAAGDPLWVLASLYSNMGPLDPQQAQDASFEQVDNFLRDWATGAALTTRNSPEWPETAASLQEADSGGGVYWTPYQREAYQAIRDRNLPMICFTNGWESSECIIVDPGSNQPTVFLRFGV